MVQLGPLQNQRVTKNIRSSFLFLDFGNLWKNLFLIYCGSCTWVHLAT